MLSENLINSPKMKTAIAKGDSAATHNYWRDKDKHCLTSLEQAPLCNAILPNVSNISLSLQGQFLLSNKLSAKVKMQQHYQN